MRIEGIFRVRLVGSLLLGELIAYSLAILANGAILFHYIQSVEETHVPLLIARTFGHLLCLNFAILVILPQRNSIWVPILGISVERMIKYHRIMGRVVFTTMSIHMLLFWYYWFVTKHFISAPHHLPYALMTASIIGHSAWLCVFVMLLTSLEFVRRSKFELFYYTHHLFLAVVGLAVYHTYLTQRFSEDMLLYWLVPGIVMYVGDLLVRAWRSRQSTILVSVVRDDCTNILLVKLKRKGFKFEPGQYVYINIPQISLLQWHPFSIFSAPSESQTRDTLVSLAIRDMGRGSWTREFSKLVEETLLPENIKVRLDGPYGKLSIDLNNYPILVLVAGGIGIAPLISILSEYNNNPSLAFDKVYCIWCAKHSDYLTPFAYTLQDIEANDMLGKLEIHRYATRDMGGSSSRYHHLPPFSDSSSSPSYSSASYAPSSSSSSSSQRGLSLNSSFGASIPQDFTPGRPVLRDFFARLVARHATSRIGVVVCGPTVMADDVGETCSLFNKSHKPKIDFHRESFSI